MWILPVLGYIGMIAGFVFLTLAIASGLYYLSELVEEHTVFSKKLLTRLIHAIIATHFLLLVLDGFPVLLTLFSAASHGVYLLNVSRTFPLVRFSDPIFILSGLLVLANHFLWFSHFSHPQLPPDHPFYKSNPNSLKPGSPMYNDYSSSADPYFLARYPTFTEISAFFGICVWMVPFSLFISLSAGDSVLPSINEASMNSGQEGKRGKKNGGVGIAKMAFGGLAEWVRSTGEVLGVWKGEGTRHARFE